MKVFLNEIEKDLDKLRDECLQLLNGITALQIRIQKEISQRNNVELFFIPPKKRKPNSPMKQEMANSLEAPILYDRMKECGFTLSGIKALFGERSHIMAKISYGQQRFTDYEAEKLTELLELTEEEQRKYFRKGIIRTKKHPVV